MSKKSNRRKRYRYTKHEFINICCSKCGICEPEVSPDLCYSELYTMQPKRFIKVVFRNLLQIRRLADEKGYINLYTDGNEYLEYLFKNAFCSANLCGKYDSDKQCENIIGCLAAFRRQVKGYKEYANITIEKNGKKKKKKHRYVAKAYPTFFTNGNSAFLEEIKIITENFKKEKEQKASLS